MEQERLYGLAQDDLDRLLGEGEGTERLPHVPGPYDRQPGENRAEHRARLKRERRKVVA
jgi:hypothetical protein